MNGGKMHYVTEHGKGVTFQWGSQNNIIQVYECVYILEQTLLYGILLDITAGGSGVANSRLGVGENDEFRLGIIESTFLNLF